LASALAFVYRKDEPGRRTTAKLLTRDGGAADRRQHRQAAGAAEAAGGVAASTQLVPGIRAIASRTKKSRRLGGNFAAARWSGF
jgi:hypothetical protein